MDAIKASVVSQMRVQFIHVYRECNKVPDIFAKYNLSLEEGFSLGFRLGVTFSVFLFSDFCPLNETKKSMTINFVGIKN